MSIIKTREHYLGINGNKKHNCAQAVIAGFKDKFSLDDELVAKFAAYGGGKTPEGYCGALYASRHILKNANSVEIGKITEDFIKTAGSDKCKEIRAMKKLTCLGCVEKAAEILEVSFAGNTVNQL